jgi:hypothetical protein
MNLIVSNVLDLLRAHADILPMALASAVALAAVAASVLAWVRSRAWVSKLERQNTERAGITEDAIASLRSSLAGLSAQLDDLRRTPAVQTPTPPRPAFNLSKRSQALRMHRHGEGPDQIASALELPKQEVDLLLKVHRLVIRNL